MVVVAGSRRLAPANLRGPGTGDRLNGNVFLKASVAGQTVFDDGVQDKMTGSSGQDWFFLLASDGATDQKNEPVNSTAWSFFARDAKAGSPRTASRSGSGAAAG